MHVCSPGVLVLRAHVNVTGEPELSPFPAAGPLVGTQAHSSAGTWHQGSRLLT